MPITSTHDLVAMLERQDQLLRVRETQDPNLEMAALQRRMYAQKGPALLFESVRNSPFPAVCNLFGTRKRYRTIFGQRLDTVRDAVQLKADPAGFFQHQAWRHPIRTCKLPFAGLNALPKQVSRRRAPVLANKIRVSDIPQIHSWPDDGGAFLTLPQVISLPPGSQNPRDANIGMYRVQLSGNDYKTDEEVGLHYQIHRGLGIHHAAALRQSVDLKITIALGGPAANTVAAVMPMPETMSETIMAGMLAGRRWRYTWYDDWLVPADADFCILGTLSGEHTKPEGPFGDHLGYYSLKHPFPYLDVAHTFARADAILPFTVVGRPPQEDSSFGELIHDLTAPMVPKELPGVRTLHAVDAAGVHPLLLAKGSERYVPYATSSARPQELLTQACAILGFNQCSLAKYLWIQDDSSGNAIDDVERFLCDSLKRINLRRDLHFHTRTTMDTLDYSGDGLNEGSKLVIASRGQPTRELGTTLPPWAPVLCKIIAPGILVWQAPEGFSDHARAGAMFASMTETLQQHPDRDDFPLLVAVDELPEVVTFNDFLWTTFTRSNPSHDIYGVNASFTFKHWGCDAPMIIDARRKPHHAPELKEPVELRQKMDIMSDKILASWRNVKEIRQER